MWRSSFRLIAFYWLLGLVSAAIVWLWAGTPLPEHTVAEQQQRIRPTGFVYGDQEVSQIVEVPRDGITAIRFWLLAHQRDGGSVVLRVGTPENPEANLAVLTIPLSDLPDRPPVIFELPPFTAPITPVLLFTLEAPELDRAHAVTVLGGDNTYGRGLALINGDPRPLEDVSFQALAHSHQGDQLLPFSRVAGGRPGLFGQPAFYAVMLWLGLWAYGGTLLMIARWIAEQHSGITKPASPYATRRLTDT